MVLAISPQGRESRTPQNPFSHPSPHQHHRIQHTTHAWAPRTLQQIHNLGRGNQRGKKFRRAGINSLHRHQNPIMPVQSIFSVGNSRSLTQRLPSRQILIQNTQGTQLGTTLHLLYQSVLYFTKDQTRTYPVMLCHVKTSMPCNVISWPDYDNPYPCMTDYSYHTPGWAKAEARRPPSTTHHPTMCSWRQRRYQDTRHSLWMNISGIGDQSSRGS